MHKLPICGIVKLSILDTINMVINMPIVGQEYVKLKIVTPGVGEIDFTDNVFVVHRVSLRTDSSNSSQIYELSLVPPESLRNARTRVSKSYDDTVSNIVTSILRDERYINTNKEFNAIMWLSDTIKKIDSLQFKNKVPIVVGGSGLYLEFLCKGINNLPIISDKTKKKVEQVIQNTRKKKYNNYYMR